MNRNYPRYSRPTGSAEQAAISCSTSVEVWAAIELIAGMTGRSALDVWNNPTRAESDNVEMAMGDWCAHGDIEPGTYDWGCEKIEVYAK